ncbi:MAG: FAD-dependent oxidoreductase [Haloarculaceae archaeon]
MDTVVVGGGIVGVASAYYLATGGADVTLVEKSHLGAGSTDRANGGIRAQFSSPVSAELSLASIDVWETFGAEFGTDIGYRRPGYLFLARKADTADRFRETVRRQNELGVPSEFIGPEEAREHCPRLRAQNYVGGTYSPTDGFADPHLALQGFAAAAREAGVEIRTGVAVTDVVEDATGRVAGVETDEGTLAAEYVVNAAGAWASRVGRMAGLDLPVSPRRRKLAVLRPREPVSRSVPFTIDSDAGVHFRPEREGDVVAGGHFGESDPEHDPDDVATDVSLEWAADVIEGVADVAGYFGPDTAFKNGWAGLYAVTPDHHPIIEETRPGFVNAVGFSGHGFMQAPATGQLVAELVFAGEPSLVDVSALAADRFERGALLEEGAVID